MGFAQTVSLYETMESFGNCCKCGVNFMAPQAVVRRRREDGETFYCPNGHGQVYTETEVMKLRRRAEAAESNRDFWKKKAEREELSHRATKGQLTKTRKRIQAGVCPCCKRTFQNVARHMKTKHPEFETAGA